jgi:uncharacterized protein YndB with AHSA1/START domain
MAMATGEAAPNDTAGTDTIPPVLRTVTVRCSVEHAFRVFTEAMGSWWPLAEFSRAADEQGDEGITASGIRFEGRVGGRIVEIMSDGTEAPWGEVLEWEPPTRAVFSWKPHPRPIPPTEVEVRFTAEGDSTRVDLEHRGWERLGDIGHAGRQEYAKGWPHVIALFAHAAEASAGA